MRRRRRRERRKGRRTNDVLGLLDRVFNFAK